MHRRRSEELKGAADLGADSSKSSYAGMGFSEGEEKRPLVGSWSAPALLGLSAILSLTVWSLPAVGVGNKLDLLRQSWHLNTVLDEGARLHAALEAAQKEKTSLQAEMEKEQARAVDLQRRLTVSDGQTRSLRTQLATEQGKRSTMQNANNDQQAQIDVQRKKRKAILHKLQALKRAELAQLAGLDVQAMGAQTTSASNAAVGAADAVATAAVSQVAAPFGFANFARRDRDDKKAKKVGSSSFDFGFARPRRDKSAEDKFLNGMGSAGAFSGMGGPAGAFRPGKSADDDDEDNGIDEDDDDGIGGGAAKKNGGIYKASSRQWR